MTKEQILENFDPSQPGLADATIFGLPFSAEQSEIIVIPVPWEVTVSYGSGASKGPDAVLDASFQVDLNHQEFPDLWKLGIYLDKAIRNPEAVKQLEQIDEVIECHYTTGNWSIFVKILCRDNEHLMELLNKKIQSVEGVSRTETFISLQQQLNRQIRL